MAPNCDAFIIAAYAALWLGAVLMPVNPRLAPPEVPYLLRYSGSRLLVFEPSLAENVEALNRQDLGPQPTLPVSLGHAGGYPDAFAGRSACALADCSVAESDDAIIVYTSGTTGFPKGVLLDHHRALWAGLMEIPTCGLTDGERYLHVAPLYHGAGITFLTTITVLTGTHVVLPGFEPGAVLEAIERKRITAMLGVPTMYQFFLREPIFADRDLTSWRVGVFGAAPMPEARFESCCSPYRRCG
jgi:acyl-CoA synthetase (AMP-forming)/AMP-acid ligase II